MCGSANAMTMPFWHPDDASTEVQGTGESIYRHEVLETIESVMASLDEELRALSLDIHAHPEVRWEEHRTHDALTVYMKKKGWAVTKHYLLPTAWEARSTYGTGGPILGVNSEMDALPGIGHACGHNLIAIAGVAVALAVRAALETHDIPGTVILLGTPAEGGGGKAIFLEKGAYEGMAACLMCHPAPGPKHSASLSSCLARQILEVEFFGIPTVPNGGNHTVAFTEAAATVAAHRATLNVAKALAATGVRVLDDTDFRAEVRKSFNTDCRIRDSISEFIAAARGRLFTSASIPILMSILPHQGQAFLPPEIWDIIIPKTSRAGQRSCLFVCRSFYGIAARTLFSSVYIHLGLCDWRWAYRTRTREEIVQLERDNITRASALLEHIAHDVVFASYVRKMAVYVFINEAEDRVFKARRCLLSALKSLHNLTTFVVSQYRSSLDVDQECIDALALAHPPLRELHFPQDGPMNMTLGDLRLDSFDHLESVTLQLEAGYRVDGFTGYDREKDFLRTLTSARRDTLQCLKIGGNLALDCPDALAQVLHLRDLELHYSEGVDEVETIIQRCPNLHSFGLASYSGDHEGVMEMFARNSSALPHLTSLRYTGYDPLYGKTFTLDGLVGFVREKALLRRLDFAASYRWEQLKTLLPFLRSSQTLQTLGLSLQAEVFREDDARHLQAHLPSQIRALRVHVSIKSLEVDADKWHGLWTHLSELRFIYVHEEQHERGPVLDIEQLASRAPRLQVVGVNGRFREVERGSDGSVALSAPWPMFKIATRDFDCDDWEWLMFESTLPLWEVSVANGPRPPTTGLVTY
ncbi:predicted protein [Postia placenta Mad-698-R]|nr:predicted protein [Postia placenta Mad-698-R]